MQGQADDGRGDGIAGRLTWQALDREAPHQPVPVSITPAPVVTPPGRKRTDAGARFAENCRAAAVLLREYRRFREVNGLPCGQGITNQCAIRMSVALMRSDIGFHFDRTRIRYTHTASNRRCGTGVAHNASASRLIGIPSRNYGTSSVIPKPVHERVDGRTD